MAGNWETEDRHTPQHDNKHHTAAFGLCKVTVVTCDNYQRFAVTEITRAKRRPTLRDSFAVERISQDVPKKKFTFEKVVAKFNIFLGQMEHECHSK